MNKKRILTLDQTKAVGKNWGSNGISSILNNSTSVWVLNWRHGTANPTTDVTNDDPVKTGKIALAHLTEFPDYYTRLAKMEEEAKSFWGSKKLKKTTSGSR